MADISPTSISVISGRVQQAILGEAVTVLGQLLYYDSTTGKFKLSFARGTTAESVVYAMALELGVLDNSIRVLMPGGIVKFDAVLTQGLPYYLSPTPGMISNSYADLITGDHVSSVGIAQDTQNLLFNVLNSRVTVP